MLGPRSSDNDREAFAQPASKNFQNKLTKLVHSVSVADTILTHTSKNVGQYHNNITFSSPKKENVPLYGPSLFSRVAKQELGEFKMIKTRWDHIEGIQEMTGDSRAQEEE